MSGEIDNEDEVSQEKITENVNEDNNDDSEMKDNDTQEIVRKVINNILDKFKEINSKRNSMTSTPSKLNQSTDENGIDLFKKEVQSLHDNIEKLDNQLNLFITHQNCYEKKLSMLEIKVNEFEKITKPTLKQNRSSFDCQDTKLNTKRDLVKKKSVGTSSDDLMKTAYISEEESPEMQRRQSQARSSSVTNRNVIKRLSYVNQSSGIYNRRDSDENDWYARQLEEIKHLPTHELLQRILH
ncbi:unnamed protein product [Schistosoma turkestanicum]|nr:unnamed protein product [Schistosoma turkestanicum]